MKTREKGEMGKGERSKHRMFLNLYPLPLPLLSFFLCS